MLLFQECRQLTTNSSELPVRTAAIAPDGKRLAFSDIKGLHIKNIETGENTDIPVSQKSAGGRVDWQIMAWFPDGGSFLANIAPFEDVCLHCEHFSAWVVPANGGVPQKVRDDANAESVSPDGSRIAFTADLGMPGGHEIWLTDSKGDSPTKIYKTNTNEWVRYVKWSPDGRRLSYIRSDDQREILESRELEVPHRPRSCPNLKRMESMIMYGLLLEGLSMEQKQGQVMRTIAIIGK